MRRIFFDMIEVNIGISVIILLVCLSERKLRERYGARWFKMVWLLLAIRLLIPYNFSLPFTELRLLNTPQFEQEEQSVFQWQSKENIKETETPLVDIPIMEDTDVQQLDTDVDSVIMGESRQRADYGTPFDVEMSETDTIEMVEQNSEATPTFTLSYATIFTAIWIVGLGAGLCYFSVANINFYAKCKRTLCQITEGNLVSHINELQEQMLGKVALPIYESDVVSSPMLVGVASPKLVLPSDKTNWKEGELKWVIIHEICHYKAKDLWLKMIMMLVWCLNWFNPFIYMMKQRCYYHIELSCDEMVLRGQEREKRSEYASVLLSFAAGKQTVSSFTTHFGDGKKRMKQRIDNVLDMRKKHKGTIALFILCVLIAAICMFISCGYKPLEERTNEENVSTETIENVTENEEIREDTSVPVYGEFSYNHYYNKGTLYHNGNIYYSKQVGIYRVQPDGEELLFTNRYAYIRGMEVDKQYLYFCGSVQKGEEEFSTIYRMDLNTSEVIDLLENHHENYKVLCELSMNDNILYTTKENGDRIGFRLDENGYILDELKQDDESFLYSDYNAYIELSRRIWDTGYDSPEYHRLVAQRGKMQVPVIDPASCMNLLNGNQIVETYKNEVLISVFLKKPDGSLEYLCDREASYPVLVTDEGIYYAASLDSDIYYTDYETKQSKCLAVKSDGKELWLINYDKEYIYYIKSPIMGEEGDTDILYRMPREGGESEAVYQIDGLYGAALYKHCSIVEGNLYWNEQRIPLKKPTINKSETDQELEPPTKEQVLSMREAVLEGMLDTEIKRLAENIKVANQVMEKAYFYDNLFERLADPENLYWNYFDQKEEILVGYTKEMEPIMEYNRFDANNFVILMQEMRDSLKNDLLKEDFDVLIQNTLLAKKNHDVEYAKQVYRILHDMDYFLLRYGPEDVGKYTNDDSTVEKYYGVLKVYKEEE